MNFSIEKVGDRATAIKMLNVLTGPAEKLNKHVNETIKIIGFTISDQQYVDRDTGELKQVEVARIVTDDFKCLRTSSYSVVNALKVYRDFFSPSDIEKGISVDIKMNDNNGLYLELNA